jgi:SAM-dependent methyltransferase
VAEDQWTAGAAYEAYIGRWSRPVAAAFVDWLAQPDGLRWLDVGCGTGALTGTVLARADPAEVAGVDPAAGFLASAQATITDPRVAFHQAYASELPFPAHRFDVVVSALALNFVPEPRRAVQECARVLAPGGVAAAYVWDYAEGMAMLRLFWDAATALDPVGTAVPGGVAGPGVPADEGLRFPLCRPEPLRALWADAGLTGVSVQAIDVPTVFADFDDYWRPFLGGQGPAPGYVATLPDERRAALRDRLKERLGPGPIALTARAWAVRGQADTS